MKKLITLCLAVGMVVGCSEHYSTPSGNSSKPDTLIEEYDEAEMEAAIKMARGRVDEFLNVLEEKGADSFSVKAPIQDGDNTEHFWIVNVSFEDGVFTGEIGNDPGVVKNVQVGQAWQIKKDEISDWMYTRGAMIHGGFTIDPLLNSFPKDKADALRASLVR